ncbi:MAG: polysaccharide pyruvyl transferase family protein [Cyanobacteria bacterium J06614_10]
MKLFYYQRCDQKPNFGDELNRWLWPQLSADLLDTDESVVFLGTGTLLNDKLPGRVTTTDRLVIFGTGAGYESPLGAIPKSWDIHCVRGPLSAKQLGLPQVQAIADGGLLVAQLRSPNTQRSGCSFMPHIHHANEACEQWQQICQQANIRYIDPRWPVEEVLAAIGSSDRLLAEAMHGAIVADALRVPWIPIVTGPRIYRFKWQDWCASMNLFYHPYRLPALKSYKRWGRGLRSGQIALKHWLGAALEGPISMPQYELLDDQSAIARRLANIAKQAPTLSDDAIFSQRVEQLHSCFSQLCQQYLREPIMH